MKARILGVYTNEDGEKTKERIKVDIEVSGHYYTVTIPERKKKINSAEELILALKKEIQENKWMFDLVGQKVEV